MVAVTQTKTLMAENTEQRTCRTDEIDTQKTDETDVSSVYVFRAFRYTDTKDLRSLLTQWRVNIWLFKYSYVSILSV